MAFNRKISRFCMASLACAGVSALLGFGYFQYGPDTACRTWTDPSQPDRVFHWSGPCENGVASGSGSLDVRVGGVSQIRFKGMMAGGEKHGQGIKTWANGTRYEGPFFNNARSGKGVMTWNNGDRYEGEFAHNKLNGEGTYIWANGTRFEGTYLDGLRTGPGKMVWNNGDRYEGDFIDDERTGKGIYIWANNDRDADKNPTDRSGNSDSGSRYDGGDIGSRKIRDDKLIGVQQFPGTALLSRYEGDFIDGKRTGKGVMFWGKNSGWAGDQYEGDFVDGERSGKGKYFWAYGDSYEGDFVDGKRTGKGVFKTVDGERYEGDFVDGAWTGKGFYFWPNGDRYDWVWQRIN